jgi:hypothetical protein
MRRVLRIAFMVDSTIVSPGRETRRCRVGFQSKKLALPDYNSDQTVIIGVQHVVDYRLSLKRASLRHRPTRLLWLCSARQMLSNGLTQNAWGQGPRSYCAFLRIALHVHKPRYYLDRKGHRARDRYSGRGAGPSHRAASVWHLVDGAPCAAARAAGSCWTHNGGTRDPSARFNGGRSFGARAKTPPPVTRARFFGSPNRQPTRRPRASHRIQVVAGHPSRRARRAGFLRAPSPAKSLPAAGDPRGRWKMRPTRQGEGSASGLPSAWGAAGLVRRTRTCGFATKLGR